MALLQKGEIVSASTEVRRMCVRLPLSVMMFERFFPFVWDRRTDLRHNIQLSVDRIRGIVEIGVNA